MKFNKFLATYLLTILILVGLGCYALDKVKSEVYFNMWLNHIINKGRQGDLFKVRDFESGLADNLYKINDTAFAMGSLESYIKYDRSKKILSIFLSIPKVENGVSSSIRFSEIKKDQSKEVCKDAYLAIMHYNSLMPNGEEFSKISNFVNSIKCNFLSENIEDLTSPQISTGGWVFKINGGNEQPIEIKGE
jgi:hypothetical protein